MTQNHAKALRSSGLPARLAAISVLLFSISLSGCSALLNSEKKGSINEDFDANPPPADQLYAEGLQQMQRGNYDQAVKKFNEIDEDYPYSTWATHSEVLAGYSQYKSQDYTGAINSLSRYIALHPTDQEAAYAYYLKALCYYEQIDDVARDQSATFEAIQTLNDVITRYPDSAYARDARIKLRLATNRLAGHEMVIGRYYEKQHLYAAAIGRFQNVVQTYQTTTYTAEALERTTECYLDLGLTDAAQRTASVLAYNYPGSSWYQAAYAKLLDHNLVADAQTPPPPKKSHGLFGLF
jgi:outer membrane protein assembly factor BamD